VAFIDSLKLNQIFVFGSNGQGFHGAGAAGYAMLHVSGNQWRTTRVPETQLYLNDVANGTKGYWAVKGEARGMQQGLYGSSYAIQTVTRPGAKQSITRGEILKQISTLAGLAQIDPRTEYLVAPLATGYGGYSVKSMDEVWNMVDLPPNIRRL
jgi:hypothetical protein